MSIPFADQSDTPAGDIVRRQLPITSRNAFANTIKNALIDAGWTADPEGEILPTATIAFTGVPGNNEVCAIGTVTYTWKTTLTGAANEVLRGGSAAACASNLFDAITDNSSNEGVTYGTGTVENPHATAEMLTATTVKLTGRELSDTGVALSENSGSTAWNRGYLGDGWIGKLWSGRTPQGLQFKLEIMDPGTSNYINLIPASHDGTQRMTFIGNEDGMPDYIQPTLQYQPEIIASKYHLVVFYPGFSYGPGNCYIGTVYLPQRSAPMEIAEAIKDSPSAIAGATNTSPIEITSAGHGLETGMEVAIEGVEGNTAANDTFVVIKTGAETFTLNGSTGNGEYTGGGAWTRTDAITLTIDEHELADGDSVYLARGSLDPEMFQLNGSWTITVVDASTIRLRGSNTALGESYDTDNPTLCACPTQCSQAVWAGWDVRGYASGGLGGTAAGTWRNRLPYHDTGGFGTAGEYVLLFNGYNWYDNPSGDLQLYGTVPGRRWWGGRYWLREAVVAWSTRGYNGSDPPEAVGFLFNAAIAMCSIPMDSILTDSDGEKWLAFSYDRGTYGAQLLWQIPDGYN